MKSLYPQVTPKSDVRDILKKIVRARIEEDVPGWNNLPNKFVSGRTTFRIPASSTDVQLTDRVGDVTNDSAFFYYVIQQTSTMAPTWCRIAHSTGF